MDILLSVSKSEASCKLFNKSLLEYVVGSLDRNHRLYIFAPKVNLDFFDRLRVVAVSSEMEAIGKFSSTRNDFIFVNRLALCNLNFENLTNYHVNHGKSITVVSKNLVKDKTLPIYKLDAKKAITAVTRKRFIDCGIYLFKRGLVFDGFRDVHSLIENAISLNEVRGFVHKGYWWSSSNVRKHHNQKRNYPQRKNGSI